MVLVEEKFPEQCGCSILELPVAMDGVWVA